LTWAWDGREAVVMPNSVTQMGLPKRLCAAVTYFLNVAMSFQEPYLEEGSFWVRNRREGKGKEG
jgi:hypothetical protein